MATRELTAMLVGVSMSVAACGRSADEPLPKVKGWPQVVECSLPPPAALQVAGDHIEACLPDTGEFHADVGLTISADGSVTALRMSKSTTTSVAECIRKLIPSMEFVVPESCDRGPIDVELAFSGGGVS